MYLERREIRHKQINRDFSSEVAILYNILSYASTSYLPDATAALRNAAINFVTSVRPSAWNNSAPTTRIFMIFDNSIYIFFKTCKKIQFSLKFNNSNGYFK